MSPVLLQYPESVQSAVLGVAPSGDTTGATDYTAITNALTASGTVLLQPGTFYLGARSIDLSVYGSTGSNVSIMGAGIGLTQLRWDGTGNRACIYISDGTQRVARITDMYLRQTGAANDGTGILGDFFTAQSVIERIRIDGTSFHPLYGIRFGVASNNTHYYCVRDCRIQVDGTNAIAIDIKGGTSLGNAAHSGVIDNCRIQISTTDATQIGINVGARAITIIHPDIETFMGTAIRLNKTAGGVSPYMIGDGCTIVNPYIETGSVAGGICLQVDSGIIGAFVVGGTLLASDAAAVAISDSGTNTKIEGIRFVNSANVGGIAYDQYIVQSDAVAGKIIQVTNTSGTTPTDATVRIDAKTSADLVLGGRVTGDAANRWRVDTNGKVLWGAGAGAPDVALQRGAAGQLAMSTDASAGTFKTLDPFRATVGSMFLAPTGAKGQTLERNMVTAANQVLTTSGTMYVTAIYLPAGVTISNISMMTGTTLKTGGTHGWYCLLDSGLVCRDATADQVDAATKWGVASTIYTLPTTAGYVTTYTGLYYVGVMVANTAGTQPGLQAGASLPAGFGSVTPLLSGTSTTGMTTPPATDGSFTAAAIVYDGARRYWAWIT